MARRLLLLLALAALPLASAHDSMALNRVVNGGFELVDTGWTFPHGGLLITSAYGGPVPCLGSEAFYAYDSQWDMVAYQNYTLTTATLATQGLLDFSADVVSGASNSGSQVIEVVTAFPSSSAPVLASVSFSGGLVHVRAYNGAEATTSIPTASGCHHYQVALDSQAGTGSLSIDGVSAGVVASGLAAAFLTQPAGYVVVGDIGPQATAGAAPSVVWDGIYFNH